VNNEEVTSHLLDIKVAIATIQQQNVEMKQDLFEHNESTKETKAELDKVKQDVREAKVVLTTLKWVIGFVIVSAPAAAAALLKLYNSL